MLEPRSAVRRLLNLPLTVVVALYVLLTDAVWPLVRPVLRWLGRLDAFRRTRDILAGLPPYPALVALAVPFAVLEPLKILALVITAQGRLVAGTALLVVSHGLSLILVERLFTVVRPQLLTLPWFASLWSWVTAVRDRVTAWLESTAAWAAVQRLVAAARRLRHGVVRAWRRLWAR